MSRASGAEGAVLRPLLLLAAGVAAGGAAGVLLGAGAGPAALAGCAAAGCSAVLLGLRRRTVWVLWLAGGVALGFASGSREAARADAIASSVPPGTTVRASFRILEGWTSARWGTATGIRILSACRNGAPLPLHGRARLEVRGPLVRPSPAPGSTVEALLSVRSADARGRSPFLVASSPRLLQVTAPPSGAAGLRDAAARSLLRAAGTSARRIRAAELAAALSLGRRDLLPRGIRDRWRASGLAHVLAVSGLHVGVVAGMLWLLGILAGVPPTPRRLILLAALPCYILVAGAAPSAVRAGLMLEIYLLARLAGRHVLPLGAVALAATVMVLARPAILWDAGFQLTVVVTSAILRWAEPLAGLLPAPRRLALAASVPVVAQAAAAPLVAWHFHELVPAAVLSNLLALGLLPALIVLSLAAAAAAPVLPPLAALLLSPLATLSRLALAGGATARAVHLTLPRPPLAAALAGLAALLVALLPGRTGRRGLAATAVVAVVISLELVPAPAAKRPRVVLLPVADGASVLLEADRRRVLVDGGRRRGEADVLLARRRWRSLDAVVATHTDEDHLGGLLRIIRRRKPRVLLLPRWMLGMEAAVPLLRSARAEGAAVVPLVRGSALSLGRLRLCAAWPPRRIASRSENDRSLVLLAELPGGRVLLPADVTARVEPRFTRQLPPCGLLIVPHHGSRGSSSSALLERIRPRVALIPAGPLNRYHHPHRETTERLRAAHVPFLVSRSAPWCGAEVGPGGRWRLVP